MANPKSPAPADESFGTKAEVVAAELSNKMLALAETNDPSLVPAGTVAIDIAARIMQAESVDDILGMGDSSALGADAILNRPFVILEPPKWMKSAEAYAKSGPGVFVVLTLGMQDTNEVTTVTCGGTNVLTQCLRAHEVGSPTFGDAVMQFIQRETNAGFNVLWLSRWQQ